MKLVLSLLCLLAIAAPAGAASGPRLALLDASPVTVTGAGFGARTAVHVTVSAGATQLSRTVRTAATGRFVARFTRSLPDATCVNVVVTAASIARRATLKIVPSAGCGADHVTSDP